MKNYKILALVAISAVAVVLSGCSLIGNSGTKKPVTIGALLPLTGTTAYWGVEVKKGMDLALSEINKDGVVFNVAYEDTQSKADVAVTAAQKFISVDQVNTLYTHFSGISSAVSPVAKTSKIPLYYDAFTG